MSTIASNYNETEAALIKAKYNGEVSQNLVDRILMLQKCEESLEFREVVMERCRRDIIFWINNFVVAYNPRTKPAILPLYLFPRQIECISWIVDRYDKGEFATVVKARYCGASWLASCVLLHKILFSYDFVGCFASNKASSVDKLGNPDALFSKVEMIIKRLPSWMCTINLDTDRKVNLLINRATNSTLIGQSGRDIGRGGRSSMVFVDEFAFVQFDTDTLSALSENTDCAIFISTPNGKDNQFFTLSQNDNVPTFYYHWTDDLRRTPEWRKEQTLRFGKHIASQELDCSFDTSLEGQLIENEWSNDSINSHNTIDFEESYNINIGADIAVSGSNKTVVTVLKGRIVIEIITLPAAKLGQTTSKLVEICHRYATTGFNVSLTYDGDGVGSAVTSYLDDIPNLRFAINEFHGGSSPSDTIIPNLNRSPKDLCANARAYGYWKLRETLRKTSEVINGIYQHDASECISIPQNSSLLVDLGKTMAKHNNAGKLLMESKMVMRQKGISSPDYSDSLMMALYHDDNVDFLGSF
ncbi:MAG: terminase large subunit domain-containing protein [Waterburya sp.]